MRDFYVPSRKARLVHINAQTLYGIKARGARDRARFVCDIVRHPGQARSHAALPVRLLLDVRFISGQSSDVSLLVCGVVVVLILHTVDDRIRFRLLLALALSLPRTAAL